MRYPLPDDLKLKGCSSRSVIVCECIDGMLEIARVLEFDHSLAVRIGEDIERITGTVFSELLTPRSRYLLPQISSRLRHHGRAEGTLSFRTATKHELTIKFSALYSAKNDEVMIACDVVKRSRGRPKASAYSRFAR